MTSNARIDSELEAFIPLFPPADLTDPVTARKNLAELAAAAPEPDTTGMEIEDRTIPADPDVPVRIYRPHRAHSAIIWLHGGGFVMGDLETEHPWAARVAAGSGAVVVSVGYRLAPEQRFPAALDTPAPRWPGRPGTRRTRRRPRPERGRRPRRRRRARGRGGLAGA